MSVKKLIGIGCYYCEDRLNVEPRALRKIDTAHEELRMKGKWILAVRRLPDENTVVCDPCCYECGRGVVSNMLAVSAGGIDADAKRRLQEIYPELFT